MRIVANRNKEEIFVAPPKRGRGAMKVSGSDFHSVGASLHADLTLNEKSEIYERCPSVFDRLSSIGAIDQQLNWLHDVRIIDAQHHLRTLQIECLLKCNLLCSYCYCSAGNKRTERIEADKLFSIVREAENLGVMSIDFTGGEFLMYPWWREVVQLTRELKLGFSVHTNASLLTERNIEHLVGREVSHIQISADSHRVDVHNQIRGSKKSFHALTDAIARLTAIGTPVYLNLMCHRHSVDHIQEAYEFFADLGAHVIIDWIAPFGSERDQGLGIPLPDFVNATQKISGQKGRLPEALPCGRDLGLELDQYEPDCGVGNSFAFITADGELALCPTITSREDSKLYAGPSLHAVSLREAWEDSPIFDKQRYFNCQNVESCPAGTLCKGGCRATALANSGSITAPDPISCNRWKNETDEFVDFDRRYSEGNFARVTRNEAV